MKSMASLSVLNYNLPPGLTMKINNQNSNPANTQHNLSKTFNKITVQNVLSENSGNSMNLALGNPNAIVRKIKDFGMIGAVNNASGAASLNINPRKRPLTENKQSLKSSENKLTSSANKKPKLSKEERAALRANKKSLKENTNSPSVKEPLALVQPVTKIPGTPGRKGLPLPQAVARRNARERNRVKQVNNGFAALRERIPEEVAEAFENQGNKASGKKLSKVETLRMAVEYIRSLERLLGFDFPIGPNHHHLNSSSGEESFSLIKDEFDAYSPSMDEQFDDSLSHYDTEEYFNGNSSNPSQLPASTSTHPTLQQMDMLPNITTLNGLQYIRIPGTNTYQLLTPDIFVGTASSPPSSTIDEEQFNALIDTNCVSPSSCSPIQQHCSTTTSADDLHNATPTTTSSSINTLEVLKRVQETAPVATEENIKEGSLLTTATTTLSPVPQSQQQQQHQLLPILTTSLSSPCSSGSGSPVLHQQQQHLTLSPASTNDPAVLRQTCAANQQQQHQEFVLPKTTGQQQQQQQIRTLHMIKQEFEEPSIIYQHRTSPSQQQQQHHQQLYQTNHNLTMSPPLDRHTPTTTTATSTSSSSGILQNFYTHQQHNSSFYEEVVTLKKEFNEVLLNASHSTHSLSDESMIETIDWWDAHTPKSDVGSGML